MVLLDALKLYVWGNSRRLCSTKVDFNGAERKSISVTHDEYWLSESSPTKYCVLIEMLVHLSSLYI